MTVALLDVNVLVALGWPNHVHHEAAHAWFAENQDPGWATCPLTQAGFIRFSSNAKVIPDELSPRRRRPLDRGRQVTDAHLLAVALARGGSVATFDGGLRSVVPAAMDREQAVAVIPPRR